MHVLFLALTIYLVGTTIVLYLRPSIMFHPGGTWKEFSLNPDPNHTNMPFSYFDCARIIDFKTNPIEDWALKYFSK